MEDLDLVFVGAMVAFAAVVVWSIYRGIRIRKKRSTYNDDRDDTKNKYL